jgi:hypothetical protein
MALRIPCYSSGNSYPSDCRTENRSPEGRRCGSKISSPVWDPARRCRCTSGSVGCFPCKGVFPAGVQDRRRRVLPAGMFVPPSSVSLPARCPRRTGQWSTGDSFLIFFLRTSIPENSDSPYPYLGLHALCRSFDPYVAFMDLHELQVLPPFLHSYPCTYDDNEWIE